MRGVRDDARKLLHAACLRIVGGQQHHGGGAIGNAGRAGRSDCAVLLAEGRFQRRDLRRIDLARCFIDRHFDIALARRHGEAAISSANAPDLTASCARRTDSVANASCSSRVKWYLSAQYSANTPIDLPSYGLVRPSHAM